MPLIAKPEATDPGGQPIRRDDPTRAQLVEDFKKLVPGCRLVTKMKRPRPGVVAAFCHGRRRNFLCGRAELGWHTLSLEL